MCCNLLKSILLITAAVGSLLLLSGCGSNSSNGKDSGTRPIRVRGSDTMANLAKAWAEVYCRKRPTVSVEVFGGTSVVDGLMNSTCDLADSSRKMSDAELKQIREQRGVEPLEHVVGYDAIAIYVNKQNPLDSVSMEQLAEIYGDGGKITKWSQLGVKMPKVKGNKIVLVGRQSGSSTCTFFRESVLGGKRDYKAGVVEESGSKDVVALVARTPGAIGYSGLGYKTDEVKVLKVSVEKGEVGIEPTAENTWSGCYPLTRSLHIYTAGEPAGEVKEYLAWIMSSEGQDVLLERGYVPRE